MARLTGTVKFFSAQKGWGFIAAANTNGTDTFFHAKAVLDGVQPKDGATVEYELGNDKQNRQCAINVSVI